MAKKQVRVSLRKPQQSEVVAVDAGEKPESGAGASKTEVDAFVAGEKPTSVLVAREVSGEVLTHNGRALRELVVHIPIDLSRQLSLHCMDRGADVNRVVAEAISAHLALRESAREESVTSSLQRYTELVRSLWTTWGFPRRDASVAQ
jgi:hypothetical protein